MEKYNFLKTNNRIPIEFRTNKKIALKLFDYIKDNNISVNNSYLYPLASWLNIDFKTYNINEEFSEVKEKTILEPEQTYDLEVNKEHSYVANGIICHNTHNLPENITIEEVNNLYIKGWKAGCKGITIYREGSRSGVLLTNDNKDNSVFPETIAPKRPKSLPADYYVGTANGIKFAVVIGKWPDGKNKGKPYEIFAFENPPFLKNTKGETIKVKKGHYKFLNSDFEIESLDLATERIEEKSLSITASMLLRHGVPIEQIIKTIKKIDENISSFSSVVRRYLSRYIENSESEEKCPNCNDKLIYQGGCLQCINPNCTYDRCS